MHFSSGYVKHLPLAKPDYYWHAHAVQCVVHVLVLCRWSLVALIGKFYLSGDLFKQTAPPRPIRLRPAAAAPAFLLGAPRPLVLR